MRGFRDIILDGGALPDAVIPSLVLLAFAAGFAAIAAWRFRFEETKIYWG